MNAFVIDLVFKLVKRYIFQEFKVLSLLKLKSKNSIQLGYLSRSGSFPSFNKFPMSFIITILQMNQRSILLIRALDFPVRKFPVLPF